MKASSISDKTEIKRLTSENKFLRDALRGGNARRDNAELFEWLADRLVFKYGENPNVDFISACRERASRIRFALELKMLINCSRVIFCLVGLL